MNNPAISPNDAMINLAVGDFETHDIESVVQGDWRRFSTKVSAAVFDAKFGYCIFNYPEEHLLFEHLFKLRNLF